MSMEITEAGRSLRFSFHSWNQKTDRIIVLSFLVSRLLLKLELPHYDLGLIHLNTQYSLCKLGTTEKYQKKVFTQKSVSWSPMSLSDVSLMIRVLLLSNPMCPFPRLLSTPFHSAPFSCTWKWRGIRLLCFARQAHLERWCRFTIHIISVASRLSQKPESGRIM